MRTTVGGIPIRPWYPLSEVEYHPAHFFGPDSIWTKPLPDDAPVAANSADLMARIAAESTNGPIPVLDHESYTAPLYIARPSDPVVTIRYTGTHPRLAQDNFQNVRIPAAAEQAAGTDAEIAIWHPPDAGGPKLVELWNCVKIDATTWEVGWGGTLYDAAPGLKTGVFVHPYGVTASGLSMLAGMITAAELRDVMLGRGEIEHAIGIGLPVNVQSTSFVAPATRTDGTITTGTTTPQGQRFRIPASVNLDAYDFHPITRAVAKAVQRYGFVNWDQGHGLTTVRCTNPQSGATGRMPAPVDSIQGATLKQMLRNGGGKAPFPWDKVVALAY